MAITKETTSEIGAFTPSGYTPPATTIVFAGDPIDLRLMVEIAAAGVQDAADPVIGYTALVAAVDTEMDTVNDTILHLDAADTINQIVTITNVSLGRGAASSPYVTGTETFTVWVRVRYE